MSRLDRVWRKKVEGRDKKWGGGLTVTRTKVTRMNDKVDRSRGMETLIAEGLAKIKSTGGSRLAK